MAASSWPGVREWIGAVGARTAFIEPDSPWENGYCESFNAKFRDELLDGEIFYSLAQARIIESWRRPYNTIRPHSALGYRPPAPKILKRSALPPGAASPATLGIAPGPCMSLRPNPTRKMVFYLRPLLVCQSSSAQGWPPLAFLDQILIPTNFLNADSA
jgi:hypothetical protein